MADDTMFEQEPKDEQQNEFEVDELNDENLEGVAGGLEDTSVGFTEKSPGSGCSNYASNC